MVLSSLLTYLGHLPGSMDLSMSQHLPIGRSQMDGLKRQSNQLSTFFLRQKMWI